MWVEENVLLKYVIVNKLDDPINPCKIGPAQLHGHPGILVFYNVQSRKV